MVWGNECFNACRRVTNMALHVHNYTVETFKNLLQNQIGHNIDTLKLDLIRFNFWFP